MMHQAIEDRRAHSVVTQMCPPVLHDAIGGDDDAAAQFVALMDHGLQQCAGVVRDGACDEQIVQHEEIAVDDGSRPDIALRDGAQAVAVEEVISLKILDLSGFAGSPDRQLPWRSRTSRCQVCRQAGRSRRRQ